MLERRLQAELAKIEPDFEYEGDVGARTPSPPGALFAGDVALDGAAAANAGALAAALGKLVCNLMINQKKSSEEEARSLLGQLDQLSADLRDASAEELEGRDRKSVV